MRRKLNIYPDEVRIGISYLYILIGGKFASRQSEIQCRACLRLKARFFIRFREPCKTNAGVGENEKEVYSFCAGSMFGDGMCNWLYGM